MTMKRNTLPEADLAADNRSREVWDSMMNMDKSDSRKTATARITISDRTSDVMRVIRSTRLSTIVGPRGMHTADAVNSAF